jgi:ZIP family zinc transporter
MDNNWIAVAAILFAGISTGIGALPVLFKKEFTKGFLNLGMGFSAGVMLVASFIALLLPALADGARVYGETWSPLFVLSALFVGYLSIVFIHEFLPHEHLIKKEDKLLDSSKSRVLLMVFAIALHNFPEGLTVGVGFGGADFSGGLSLALAISIQNMPEGLVVALGLVSIGTSRLKAFTMALLSGMIEPVAAAVGFFTARISEFSLPVSLAFAGGAMLFVTCQEIFPELFKEGNEKKATLGVIVGVIAMLLIDYYIG